VALRINWWYVLYELILVGCMIAYGIWSGGQRVSECTVSLWKMVGSLVPLVIILLMVAPGFMVFHDP
jgi:NADH:ubiquinone oxidoreductase subunit 4 (subunit M)